MNYKTKLEDVERDFLSEEELELLTVKQFAIPRLGQVRDVFLFCCYTGLSYTDVKNLRHTEISTGIDGQKWIFTNREKTDTASRIPLLPVPLELMKKYSDQPLLRQSRLGTGGNE